jgi:hypothetical protein
VLCRGARVGHRHRSEETGTHDRADVDPGKHRREG